MSKLVKAAMIEDVARKFQGVRDCFVVDYSGRDGLAMAELRHRLRTRGIRMTVVKNATALRGLEKAGVRGLDSFVVGPSALIYGAEDVVLMAKSLKEAVPGAKPMVLRGGLVEGKPIGSADVDVLASLPPKKQLIGEVILSAAGAAGAVIGAAADAAGRVIWAREEQASKSESAAGAPAASGNP